MVANGSNTVVGYNGTDTITIYLGKGDATFQAGVSYSVDRDPLSIAVGDFNGDGKMDLAVASAEGGPNYTGTVSILLGNGDGTFQPVVTYPVLCGASAVVVADFNGDGIADVASTSVYGVFLPGVSVLLGNGDGTFRNDFNFASGGGETLAVADFNSDGVPDLALGLDYFIQILPGKGDGTFSFATNLYIGGEAQVLATADFNNDGNADFFSFPDQYEQFSGAIFLGGVGGTFQALSTDGLGNPYGSAAIEDFNGDGIADIVFTDYFISAGSAIPGSNAAAELFLGQGDGNFQYYADYITELNVQEPNFPPPGTRLNLAACGDFNGDGIVDVVLAHNLAGGFTILLGGEGADIPLTIQTTPTGLQFAIDGGDPQTAPQTVLVSPGTHTLSTPTQSTSAGTQWVFSRWDRLSSNTVQVTGPATYTAAFTEQFELSTSVNPVSAGSISPVAGYYDGWTPLTLTATANPPYVFKSWSGAAGGTSNPTQFVMTAPQAVTANFMLPSSICAADGKSVPDVQRLLNEALGITSPVDDKNGDPTVNVIDLQSLIVGAQVSGAFTDSAPPAMFHRARGRSPG